MVDVFAPPALLAVSETVYVPGAMYVWTGFWTVAFSTLPSPKVHCHTVGTFADVSVKVTARGAVPVVGVPVNDVTGRVTEAADTTI
jgi:hypothetical protein